VFTLEDYLGAGGTEISSCFEEYLEIFDEFYADDIEVRSESLKFYLVFGSPAVSSCCSSSFCQVVSGLYSFTALARAWVFLPRSF
jgi:hypothetical protein